MDEIKICAVIVTYNRLEKLKKALDAYDALSRKPEMMIIVDNGSTDETKGFLDNWCETGSTYRKKVVTLESNTGGSGGFYEGIKRACEYEYNWIWVADDDAYPQKDCFEILIDYMTPDMAAVCARVDNDGGIDTWHRRRLKKGHFVIKEERIKEEEYRQAFALDLFSYVGTMLSKSVLNEVGLPEKDFFINYDDTEHSIRMAKHGKIICVPSASVYHDSPGVTADVLSWKKFYAVRNKVYSYKKHFGRRYACIISLFYRGKAFIKMMKTKDVREYYLVCAALTDGNRGKLGVDEIYRPGWK